MQLNAQYAIVLDRDRNLIVHLQTREALVNRTYGTSFTCFAHRGDKAAIAKHYFNEPSPQKSLNTTSECADYIPCVFDTEKMEMTVNDESFHLMVATLKGNWTAEEPKVREILEKGAIKYQTQSVVSNETTDASVN